MAKAQDIDDELSVAERNGLVRIAKEIRELERRIDEVDKERVLAMFDQGRLLVQGQLIWSKPGRGSLFGKWIQQNFGTSMSVRTAYHRMKAYGAFQAVSRETISRFETTALYRLSDVKFETARRKAIDFALKGTRITGNLAKGLIEMYSRPSEPKSAVINQRKKILAALQKVQGRNASLWEIEQTLEWAIVTFRSIEAVAGVLGMTIDSELYSKLVDTLGCFETDDEGNSRVKFTTGLPAQL